MLKIGNKVSIRSVVSVASVGVVEVGSAVEEPRVIDSASFFTSKGKQFLYGLYTSES